MNTQARFMKFVVSPLMMWVAILAVSSYFMVSFDKKILKQAQEQEVGIMGKLRAYASAMQLSYIKKGIDLAGGTYLVLGVEVEKAIESRLAAENKSLDSFFKNNQLSVLPEKRELKGLELHLSFDEEAAAKSCFNLMKEKKSAALRVKLAENVVIASITPESEQRVRSGAVEQAVNVLTNRLGGYGVEGIVVQQHGERQIVVQMPGVDDPDGVKKVITKTAHLEFKIVEDVASTKDALFDKFDGDLPSDKMIIPGRRDLDEGDDEIGRWYLVSVFPDMTGDRIVHAEVSRDEFNKPMVGFKLDSTGAREFGELTGNNVGRSLGIIIDDVMFSSPTIKQAIGGGSGVINGITSAKEAFDLSVVLKSGSLLAPIKFEQESRVGASLGQDSISKGMMACLIALLLLCIFSILYYRIPGLLAVLALIVNLFLVMLVLSYLGATLTLPGIAGMVLTIGMAIDASILIYEKIQEEISTGVSLKKAIDNGFSGVMAVILDSNITTFLTGLVLFYYGGPAIKGFAVTLMAGIFATLLAGIYFLKALFAFLTDVLEVKTLKF